jgi:hypothetical protein
VQVVSEPDVRPQQQEDQGLIQRNSFPPRHHLIFLLPLVAVAGGISPSADSLLSPSLVLFIFTGIVDIRVYPRRSRSFVVILD